MKKYFLFTISFFSLLFFFFFQQVPITEAWAREGEFCTENNLADEERRCDTNIHFCNRTEGSGDFWVNTTSRDGKCRPRTELDCKCDGEKNILCALPGQTNKNTPTSCEKSEDICVDVDPTFIGPADRVNKINIPGLPSRTSSEDGTERFKGISCQNPIFPDCTCLGGGNAAASGQNGIQCSLGGVVVGEGYCKDNKACRTGGTMNERDVHELLNEVGNDGRPLPNEELLRGKTLGNVTCGVEQITCTCIGGGNTIGGEKNGIRCTNNARAVIGEGYCKGSNEACIPSGTIKESDVSHMRDDALNDNKGPLIGEEDSMKDKDLIGVSCEALQDTPAPTIPPPPPPPCKKWSGDGNTGNLIATGTGTCLTFGTGLGEFETNTGEFVQSLFAILLSLSGGIALLLILKAGYQMMTSQGKPEQLQAGRDQLVAAIVGLIFLIFSFVILQIIGYDILQIPGFGSTDPGAP